MLLMFEKGIRGRLCHSINRLVKTNNKYMRNYDKNEEYPYLKYWDVNYLYGWALSQKLPVNGFMWVEDPSEFNEEFINYNEKGNGGYFTEDDVQYPENVHDSPK